MEILPFGDNIMAERIGDGTKTESGVYRGMQKEKPLKVKVIGIGKEAKEQTGLSPNQVILIQKYSGTEVEFNGKDYLFIKPNEILAIIKG